MEKKTYIIPSLCAVTISSRSNLLVDSGTRGLTVDSSQSVSTNFVKENTYVTGKSVWDNEW